MNDWEREYREFTDRLVNADTDEKFLSTKYNAHYLVKQFISSLLTKQRQKMAKALRMKKRSFKNKLRPDYSMGWNDAVEEFNQKFDSYLKKQEGK